MLDPCLLESDKQARSKTFRPSMIVRFKELESHIITKPEAPGSNIGFKLKTVKFSMVARSMDFIKK